MNHYDHIARGGGSARLAQPIRVWYQSFTDWQETAHYHDRLVRYAASAARDGTTIEVKGMSPPSRRHRVTELRCALDVVRNAIIAERQGYDAFILGHFQDSGLYEARSAVDIPVIAIGESSMLHACTLGATVGLITIHPTYIPFHREQIRRYGLHERIVDVRAVTSKSADYARAFSDSAFARELAVTYTSNIEAMVDSGIEVVLPAGGLPALLFGDEVRTTAAPAVLLDCISVAVKACEMAVDLRRFNECGVSRSRAFAKPSEAAIETLFIPT